MNNEAWDGRTSVVTGAASGIGLAMVRRFVDSGMNVVLADLDEVALDAATMALRGEGAPVVGVRTDVSDPASVDALAVAAEAAFGDVHVLCNNAGIIRPGRSWETSPDDWSTVLRVNLDGVVNGLRSFVPAMLRHGTRCHVINTASGAGLFASPSFSAYCVSKAAVIALSESFAAEIALVPDAHLQVHVLCPGSASSNLFRNEVRRQADAGVVTTADAVTARRWAETSSAERSDQVEPEIIVDAMWQAIENGTFYVLPIQTGMRDLGRARVDALTKALRSAIVLDDARPHRRSGPTMLDYFARLDGPSPSDALELLADDMTFSFSRPDGVIRGGRGDLADYIGGRRLLQHRVDHYATDDSIEFASGQSMNGDIELGEFVAAMRTDDEGRVTHYLASFHPPDPAEPR